ncbi:MAG: hypothetical protein LBF63_00515 [Treponema sp.]|jgi:tryptophan synthase beta chain|nr:hypothetical protein [Treponema sp.]
MAAKIPTRLYLSEEEIPKYWYNIRADMKEKPDPILHPGTLKPVRAEDLEPVFCKEPVRQELDEDTRLIPIPEGIQEFYRAYRPAPLVRAYFLERALGTQAEIYYKFEGTNTSGSHKLNSAGAQAYYAKEEGLTSLTTETGLSPPPPIPPSPGGRSWSRTRIPTVPWAAPYRRPLKRRLALKNAVTSWAVY